LSSRERGILQLLAEGLNNKEIAEKLSLSLNTIHVHRNNIMKKLNIHRQADLIKYALKEGIVQL
jgi:DNA-binding NarL/FixJ family response regulator